MRAVWNPSRANSTWYVPGGSSENRNAPVPSALASCRSSVAAFSSRTVTSASRWPAVSVTDPSSAPAAADCPYSWSPTRQKQDER